MPKLLTESAVLGILTNYASTVINYGLAVVYIILLTKYVPLTQYGYYNAMIALISAISLFFPTLGIDNAIAREAAVTHSSGGDVTPYYSAMFSLSFTLTLGYVAAMIASIPVFIKDGIPGWLMGIIYIQAASTLIQSLANVMGFHLWATGKVASQGLGLVLGNLAYRISEVALIIVTRSVYAIAVSVLLNSVVTLMYYLSRVKALPGLTLGYRVLKARVKSFLNFGFQFWLATYLGSAFSNLVAYLVFKILGPNYSGIYGITYTALGLLTSFSTAVSGVFGSLAAHGLGVNVELRGLSRDYAQASLAIAGLLSMIAVLFAPLLPMLHIFNGNYAEAVPYLMLFAGIAPLSAIDGVYMMYYWVSGKGWLAVERTLAGAAANVALFVLLASRLGLYAAVLSAYAGAAITMILYWVNNRPWGFKMGATSVLSVLLPALSASLFVVSDPVLKWPIPQLILLVAFTLIMVVIKPVEKSVIEDSPKFLKIILKAFT